MAEGYANKEAWPDDKLRQEYNRKKGIYDCWIRIAEYLSKIEESLKSACDEIGNISFGIFQNYKGERDMNSLPDDLADFTRFDLDSVRELISDVGRKEGTGINKIHYAWLSLNSVEREMKSRHLI